MKTTEPRKYKFYPLLQPYLFASTLIGLKELEINLRQILGVTFLFYNSRWSQESKFNKVARGK